MGVAAWALVISIFAAVTSMGSLVWQVISWRRTGPDLQLQAKAIRQKGPENSNYADERFYLEINAYNRGRGSAGVVDLWVECPQVGYEDHISHVLYQHDTIDGHHGERWTVPIIRVVGEIPKGHRKETFVCVRLGSSKVVRTRVDWSAVEAYLH